MKTLKEYLLEEKNDITASLKDINKKVKEEVDNYFKIALKETHCPSFKYDTDKMEDAIKEMFFTCIGWFWGPIPEEYQESLFKYFLRKQCAKSKVKLPEDISLFDTVYNNWKSDIDEIYKRDAEEKEKKAKKNPEYFSKVKNTF